MDTEDRRRDSRSARYRSFARDALVEATGALIAASLISIVVAFISGGDYPAGLRLLLLPGPPILILFIAALGVATAATSGIHRRMFPNRRRYGVMRKIFSGLLTVTIWLLLTIASLIGWMIVTEPAGQWAVTWINEHPEFP